MSQFIQTQQIKEEDREYVQETIETNEIRTPNYNYTNDNSYEYIIYNNDDNIIDYINIHPTIRFDKPKQNIDIIYKTLLISDEETICCICMETKEKNEICYLNCHHTFCHYCVENCLKMQHLYVCSLCREEVIVIICQKLEIIEKLKKYF
jgi:hypothetical protein